MATNIETNEYIIGEVKWRDLTFQETIQIYNEIQRKRGLIENTYQLHNMMIIAKSFETKSFPSDPEVILVDLTDFDVNI